MVRIGGSLRQHPTSDKRRPQVLTGVRSVQRRFPNPVGRRRENSRCTIQLRACLYAERRYMGKFVSGLIIGFLVLPVVAAVYVGSGLLPIGANDPPLPFEEQFAGGAVYRRIDHIAPKRDISEFKTADYVMGADVYQKDCAFCHGLPRQEAPPVAQGMFPHAPQLFTPQGTVTDDPVGVSYWKVKNGIRLSGMPSFVANLSDEQMWDVAAVVAQADKLPPGALDVLKPSISTGPSRVGAATGSAKAPK